MFARRHRGGLMTPPEPLTPHQMHEFKLTFPATSNVWRKGHRLRLTIASAHFPMAYPNPNTNAPIGDDDDIPSPQMLCSIPPSIRRTYDCLWCQKRMPDTRAYAVEPMS